MNTKQHVSSLKRLAVCWLTALFLIGVLAARAGAATPTNIRAPKRGGIGFAQVS